MRFRRAITGHCAAFTLLEVVLALAILAGSVVALGQVLRLAGQAAEETRQRTQAELAAASKMAELAAGIAPLEPVARGPLELGEAWTYSLTLEPTGVEGLVSARIAVFHAAGKQEATEQFALVRWLANGEPGPASEGKP